MMKLTPSRMVQWRRDGKHPWRAAVVAALLGNGARAVLYVFPLPGESVHPIHRTLPAEYGKQGRPDHDEGEWRWPPREIELADPTEPAPEPIDTTNHFLVSLLNDGLILLKPPTGTISNEHALNLAAYLVAMADDDDRFAAVLTAVQNT